MVDSIVLGAGMVGVSTALALQARGQTVVLLDRRAPGRETSYGNAGIIQREAAEPYPIPLAPEKLLAIATGRSPEVAWRIRTMPDWLPAVLRYAWHSLPRRYARIVPHYARLIARATADHAPLIAAAGADDLVSRDGFVQAYRTPQALDLAVARAERFRASYGIPSVALDGSALAAAEPSLRVPMAGAVHWTGSWSCRDPGGLVERYAALFAARGGTVVAGDASAPAPAGAGWRVAGIEARHAVIALGPWSPGVLARLGYRIPMVFKRGYHRHFASPAAPRLPFMDVANAALFSPMAQGLRVLTGAELNGLDAPSELRQIARATARAGELFRLGDAVEPEPWRGVRPCMPDMLPVIGPARRHEGLWFNFGHGHQGFTLGPTTGALLAEVMTGNAAPESLAPYARY